MTDSQPPATEGDLPDKEFLYGRYQKHSDGVAELDRDRRRWQNQLHKQLSYKSVDEPLLEDEEMGDIYAPRTITNTGIGTKALLALALMGLPAAGIVGAGALSLAQPFLKQSEPVVQSIETPEPAAPVTIEDRDTRMVPQLRFGPERR